MIGNILLVTRSLGILNIPILLPPGIDFYNPTLRYQLIDPLLVTIDILNLYLPLVTSMYYP